eukprot:4369752-Pleurochrysis_carterae.AAC.1
MECAGPSGDAARTDHRLRGVVRRRARVVQREAHGEAQRDRRAGRDRREGGARRARLSAPF